jgi:hypothetical protein
MIDSFQMRRGKEINQLKRQIEIINAGGFDFDRGVKEILKTSRLIIYPIITYNDFNFSLPGINVYLSEAFKNMMSKEITNNLTISPLTLLNLDTILDMVVSGQDINDLETHLNNYHNLKDENTELLMVEKQRDKFLMAHASFDEIYNWQFIKKLDNPDSIQPILHELLKLANLSFEELNTPL